MPKELKNIVIECYKKGIDQSILSACPDVFSIKFKLRRNSLLKEINNPLSLSELSNIILQSDSLVLLAGPSGSGKTIFGQRLVSDYLASGTPALWLPLRRWIDLKTTFFQFAARNILEISAPFLRKSGIFLDGNSIIKITKSLIGDSNIPLILIFDGLNEISNPAIFKKIKEFLIDFYFNKVVFISRISTKFSISFDSVPIEEYEALPLGFNEIIAFIQQHKLLTQKQKADFLDKIEKNPKAISLASSPRVLSNMVSLFIEKGIIPISLGETLEHVALMGYQFSNELSHTSWMYSVGSLSAEMMFQKTLAIDTTREHWFEPIWKDLDSLVPGFASWKKAKNISIPKALSQITSQLVLFDNNNLEFSHQSWQEFFSGYWLAANWKKMDELQKLSIFRTSMWEDSIIFTGYYLKDKPEILEFIKYVSQTESAVLRLDKYLNEIKPLSPEVIAIARQGLLDCFSNSLLIPRKAEAFEKLQELEDVLQSKDLLIDHCSKMSNSPHWLLRESTARILGELRDPRASTILLKLLSDEVLWVRAAAAWALGAIGYADYIHELMNIAKTDDDYFVRRWAGWAVKSIQQNRSIDGQSEWYQYMFENETFGPRMELDIETYFIVRLKNTDPWIRSAAVEAIGDMGFKHYSSFIINLACDESIYVRSWVMRALGKIGGEEAIKSIKTGLNDQSKWVKTWALTSAINLRSKYLIGEIQECLNEKDSEIIELAQLALGLISSEKSNNMHVWDFHKSKPSQDEYAQKNYFNVEINEFELDNILSKGETFEIEFKASYSKISEWERQELRKKIVDDNSFKNEILKEERQIKKEVHKAILGMINSGGGIVLLGINNTADIVGLDLSTEACPEGIFALSSHSLKLLKHHKIFNKKIGKKIYFKSYDEFLRAIEKIIPDFNPENEIEFINFSKRQSNDIFQTILLQDLLYYSSNEQAILSLVRLELVNYKSKIICVIKILPSPKPVWSENGQVLFVRTGGPRTEALSGKSAVQYIESHFKKTKS